MSANPFISIVSPVYKAEKIVPELVRRIVEEVAAFTNNYEILLVEDGSPDMSWTAIEKECSKNTNVKGIKLSRNFGQHYAITAGLTYAQGDHVVIMDCDLQDNPKYIKELYNTALKENDIVFTYKEKRKHSLFKNYTASLFFLIFNYLTDNKENDADKNVGAYSLLSRKAVKAFLSINEFHRHYLMIVRMLGFQKAYVKVKHEKRFEGKSSYSFSKLIKHAINGITSQSDKLLKISVSLGFIIFILSILWAMVMLYLYFTKNVTPGYTSIIVVEFIGIGLILMSIGVTGVYIGKIFEQVKERPLFIVAKSINI